MTQTQIPTSFNDLLQSPALAHIATVGPKGEPQSTPVWFGWDGHYILISQTKGRQKYRNIQREPRLALSIVDLHNAFRYLEVRGTVARVEDDKDNKFINSMAKKYMNQDTYPFHQPGDERVVVYIAPEHITKMD